MLSFTYTIQDALGIHARPAGLLAKAAKELDSKIVIQKGEQSADATRLMAVMAMGIKCGENIVINIEGGDEEKSLAALKSFFEENL